MDERCTCGAKLPEAARFCHKCGKPQYELIAEPEPEAPLVAAPAMAPNPAAGPHPIGFRNSAAVRIALLCAGAVSVLIEIPFPALVRMLWVLLLPLVGGFVAVYLYSRRTGEFLSVSGGARMGLLTGIFFFVIRTVLLTAALVALVLSEGAQQELRQILSQQSAQLQEIVSTPSGLAGILIAASVALLIYTTALTAAGGALGAKVLEKE